MKRRDVLKTLGIAGGVGVTGVGATVLSSTTAAAAGISVNSSNVTVTNTRGDVHKVTIDPELNITWTGLDEAVGAISLFVEAKVDGVSGPNSGFYPLMRAEPVLRPNNAGNVTIDTGTDGEFDFDGPLSTFSDNRTLGKDWSSGTNSNGALTVADDEAGTPDYSDESGGYLQGANVSPGTIPDDEPLVNGEYGAAADADVLNAETDGESKSTTVKLRYTVQLLEYGIRQFAAVTDYDPLTDTANIDSLPGIFVDPATSGVASSISEVRQNLYDVYDETAEQWDSARLNNTEFISDVHPDEITIALVNQDTLVTEGSTPDNLSGYGFFTNQKLPIMTGPSAEYPFVSGKTSRHAADARSYASTNSEYPGIFSTVSEFTVTAENLPGTATATGDSNTSGS
jgi:hypothetical protein